MKKLMAMIGAVAMSFGLFAAPAENYSSTSFEISDSGCSDGETFDLSLATGWSTTSEDPFALVAQSKSALPYAAEGAKARRDDLFTAGDVNDSCLKLEIPSNTLERVIGEGQIFVDQLVRFTEYDSDPELDKDSKIALWMKEGNPGEVGLYASVGTGSDVTNVQINGEYEPDVWYRLTIKALGNVRGSGTQAGFLVYVNGEPATVVAADKDYLDAQVAEDLTGDASEYYANGCLFASMITGSAAIASVGYMGHGAIDDLIISEEAPAFTLKYTFTVTPETGLKVASVTAGGEPLAGPPYQVMPDTVVRVTYEAEQGYKITSEVAYDDVTITADGQEITETSVEFDAVCAQLFQGELLVEEYVEAELYDVITSLEDGKRLAFVTGADIENPDGDPVYSFSPDTTIDVTVDGGVTTWEVESTSDSDWIVDHVGAEEDFVKHYNFVYPNASVELGGNVAGEFSVAWDEDPLEEAALYVEADIEVSGTITAANIVNEASITLSGEGKVVTQNGELNDVYTDDGSDPEILENTPEEGWYTYQIKVDDESVAQIGGKKYATLAEALADAQGTDEIVLLKDITLTEQTVIEKAITLNLNKKTISFDDGDYDSVAIRVTASGATIKNGSVVSKVTALATACFIEFSAANGTLEDLTVDTANFKWGVGGSLPGADQWKTDYNTYTITCKNVDVTGATSLFVAEGVNLTLDADCSATQSGEHADDWRNCAIHAGCNAIVTIAGGTYEGKYAIYKMSSPAKIYVNGGKFTGDVYMHELQGYTGEDVLAITAGNFKGAPIDTDYLANEVDEGYERVWVDGDETGYVKPGAQAIEYTITYISEQEGTTAPAAASYTVNTEFPMALADATTDRTDIEFVGWTNETYTTAIKAIDALPSPLGGITLYAEWKAVSPEPEYPSEWPDADDDVKAKFAAWREGVGKDAALDTDEAKDAFLLNVAVEDIKELKIESIDVDAEGNATIVASVPGQFGFMGINLADINGVLFVEAGDALDAMEQKAVAWWYTTTGKATTKIKYNFIRVVVGFEKPAVDAVALKPDIEGLAE